jgi:hypothetical protein
LHSRTLGRTELAPIPRHLIIIIITIIIIIISITIITKA